MTCQPNSASSAPLKILIVEDNPEDAELMLYELRHAGISFQAACVDTEPDYLEQIRAGADLILSDYSLPQFSGLRALELLQESGLDIIYLSSSFPATSARISRSNPLKKGRMITCSRIA